MGDYVGRLNLLWPLALLSGCLCLSLWLLSNSLAVLVLFVCLYGFTTSSVTSLPSPVIGQITPDDRLGARIGAFYSVVAIASLVGTPIGGALITDSHEKDGYRWLILLSVSTLFTSMMCLLIQNRVLHLLLGHCSCLGVGFCTIRTCVRNGKSISKLGH